MNASQAVSVITESALDLLYPTLCLGCDARGEWLCAACVEQSILPRDLDHCQLCNRITHQPGALCRFDRKRIGLTGLVSFGDYREIPLRRAIRSVKFDGIFAGIAGLVAAGQVRYQPVLVARPWTTVIPIPLSLSRLRERGFNQAEIIARAIERASLKGDTAAELLAEPRRTFQRHSANNSAGVSRINLGLVRTRDTRHQTELGRQQRKENMEGAFAWRGPRLSGAVLLVDDVRPVPI